MRPRAAYGYGLLIVGALTIAVATLLPFQKSNVYNIPDNDLIHSVSGIILLGLGVGILVTGYQTA